MWLLTMSGRRMMIQMETKYSRVFMIITLKSWLPCARSSTWKPYPSAFARPLLTASTIASLPAFALIFLITAYLKIAQPHTSVRSSRKCSRQPYALKPSTTLSGPLPLMPVALAAVKPSLPRSMPVRLRKPSPGIATIIAPTSPATHPKAHFVAIAVMDPIHGHSLKMGST